ncbi:methylated-DNA--[protein]-cysteine S-methyltransferase [Kitasatospora sp. NPDC094019]|uniref:methylated-DNA--[protein]-cysteine S-methyltransferase n=1 Tax=Kitasatospora sp. NPDC094019 TaxID=3364091 RepID=UPI00382FA2BD
MQATRTVVFLSVESPLGDLLLTGEEAPGSRTGVVLTSVSTAGQRTAPVVQPGWRYAPGALADAAGQLAAYFDGARTAFDLDLAAPGSNLHRTAWRALDAVPHGTTSTHERLATDIGSPGAARAVGAALAANPVLIVRPCHRVLGADGAAARTDAEQHLLDHERAHAHAHA